MLEALATAGRNADGEVIVDKVVGMESRGFILGAPVALALGVGFVPVRKVGKLPRDTYAVTYDLEYGSATLEIHRDAIAGGGARPAHRRRARDGRDGGSHHRAGPPLWRRDERRGHAHGAHRASRPRRHRRAAVDGPGERLTAPPRPEGPH